MPASRYEPSLRAYPEILPPIEYDTGVTVRKVQQKGEVHFQGQVFEVSRAFRGYPVGLVPTKEDGSMTYASVTIQLRGLMYVNITNQSVTYVSGTFVTLDSGLNKGG